MWGLRKWDIKTLRECFNQSVLRFQFLLPNWSGARKLAVNRKCSEEWWMCYRCCSISLGARKALLVYWGQIRSFVVKVKVLFLCFPARRSLSGADYTDRVLPPLRPVLSLHSSFCVFSIYKALGGAVRPSPLWSLFTFTTTRKIFLLAAASTATSQDET